MARTGRCRALWHPVIWQTMTNSRYQYSVTIAAFAVASVLQMSHNISRNRLDWTVCRRVVPDCVEFSVGTEVPPPAALPRMINRLYEHGLSDGSPTSFVSLFREARHLVYPQSANPISRLQTQATKPLLPSRHTSTASSTATSSFAKSFGPGRHAPSERPPTRAHGRPTHSRSKSQAPRPRTAHGHRLEEPIDAPDGNGTTNPPLTRPDNSHPSASFHVRKIRAQHSTPQLPTIRDTSLVAKFKSMSLEENYPRHLGNRVNFQPPEPATQASFQSNLSSTDVEKLKLDGDDSTTDGAAPTIDLGGP